MLTEEDMLFMDKMARYTRSANGVPVARVSIPATDLTRLIELIQTVHKTEEKLAGQCDVTTSIPNANFKSN